MRVFDLSLPLDPASGDALPPEIQYTDHLEGVPHLARLLGVEEHQVPDGLGSATEIVKARTHNGTHMDAPWHFYPTSEGRPARTIDQIPLEWCIAPGVVIDCTGIPAGEEIPATHLDAKLTEIGHSLEPGHIVFVRTDASRYYYESDYVRVKRGWAEREPCGLSIRASGSWASTPGLGTFPWPSRARGSARRAHGKTQRCGRPTAGAKTAEYVQLEQPATWIAFRPRPDSPLVSFPSWSRGDPQAGCERWPYSTISTSRLGDSDGAYLGCPLFVFTVKVPPSTESTPVEFGSHNERLR